MAINFKLQTDLVLDPDDPMPRTWVGWDPTKSDEELWDVNRGVWRLDARQVEQEQLATLSFNGWIRVVAEITGWESFGAKKALIGRVLKPGDPVREALLRVPAPRSRNPVEYFDTSAAEAISPRDRAIAPQRQQAAFLLTYNPDVWTWDDERRDVMTHTARGELFRADWSTGARRSGIATGDRVFLLRQGPAPRGIIGSGTTTSPIASAPHFLVDRHDEANYVGLEWDTLLPDEDCLPIEELKARFPDQHWEPQSSGTQVRERIVNPLDELWAAHTNQPTSPRGMVRQGWVMDAEQRAKIEDAAQDRLMEYYDELGWTVKDTRIGHPYDAIATRGDETVFLEAKGTQSAGQSVIVTPNEVAHARAHPGQCVMGILSDVRFDAEGDVDVESGMFRMLDWNPLADELKARAYDFTPGVPLE